MVFNVDLSQVNFELFKKTIYGNLVLILDLIYLFTITLLHFETLLLKLEIAIALLLKFFLKESLDIFNFFVVILLNLGHCFTILSVLQTLLLTQIFKSLIQVPDIVVFLSFRFFKLLNIPTLILC